MPYETVSCSYCDGRGAYRVIIKGGKVEKCGRCNGTGKVERYYEAYTPPTRGSGYPYDD